MPPVKTKKKRRTKKRTTRTSAATASRQVTALPAKIKVLEGHVALLRKQMTWIKRSFKGMPLR